MLALSNSLSAYFPSRCSAGIVECSFPRYFIVFQNCFLFPLLMFLVKNDCLEFLNEDVTLFCIPLYLLHNSADLDDFTLLNRLFRFRIACSTMLKQLHGQYGSTLMQTLGKLTSCWLTLIGKGCWTPLM